MAGIYEDLIDECRVIAKEGKIPADKDAEQTKINKLTEKDLSGLSDDDLLDSLAYWERAEKSGDPLNVDQAKAEQTRIRQEMGRRGFKHPTESKVNEVDEEEVPAPEDVKIKPGAEEEAPEITKEYLGKTEDTHFYIVSIDEPQDLQILDQEGVMKYSAKDNNLEPTDIPTFLIQAIQDVKIDAIERSIFVKYILPLLLEEEEPEEEEEFEEEGEEGKPKKRAPRKKKEIPPEEELPRESKTVAEAKALKVVQKKNKKWYVVSGKSVFGGPYDEKEAAENRKIEAQKELEAEVDEKKKPPICSKCNKRHWPFKACLSGKKDEGKIPADKDAEQTKINKLIEMKIRDDENNEFDVTLVDDGTIDTVIEINGREFRFSPEFASYWRDEAGTISEDGLEEMALDALSNLEEDEYSELVVKKEEIEAAPSEEETTESKVEETKLNDLTSTILGVLRSKGDETSFEELRDYLKDLNTDDYNDLVRAVELGNKDEIADIMKSVGFTESKVDEQEEGKKFGVVLVGGSIGEPKDRKPKYFDTEDDAKAYAKRMNAQLSPGEKSYYKLKYRYVEESKVNEGLESHADAVLSKAGIVKGEDYGWDRGEIEVYASDISNKIVDVLNNSGEFGPASIGKTGKISFGEYKNESKITERGIKDMSEDELHKILDHLEKVTRIGFDVRSRVKEIKDELSSRSTEESKVIEQTSDFHCPKCGYEFTVHGEEEAKCPECGHVIEESKTNEDYRQVRPGEYEVAFYDGTTKTLSAESTVDAMEKAKAESGEKRVLNVRLIKQTDSVKDVQEESETNESLDEKKHTNRLNNLLGL